MKRDKSNPVAKNLNKYNRPATHTDRKKAMKKGKVKHQKSILKDDEQQTDTSNRTNSAAKKPQNYVDPVTGKTKTRMVPVHKDVQTEKLNPSDGIRTYIDDFQKSDAPQFQGKSKEKRKEMAIAAYLDAKRGRGEEVQVEQVDEAKAPSTVKHKGKTYYSTGKQGKDIKTGAPSFEYSSDMDGNDERVFYNTKTRKVTRESVANESTAAYAKTQSNIRRKNKNAAITSSDKAKLGKLSALMKKEEVEQVDEATSKKLLDKMKELGGGQLPRSSVELRKLKAKAQDELRGARAAKKAAPVQKTTSKTSKGKTQTGSADPADRNLIMQLRKAQDALSPNTFDIIVSPTGRTINLPKKQIDSLLKKHDSLGKPVDKRKFKIMLTKALRAKAK